MEEQQFRMEEQQHLIEQLLRGSHLVPPPPVVVPPPVSSAKNKSVEPGKELRANPEFLRMALGAGSSALDVSRVVLKMFSLWGSAGSTLRQLLLWVLQLPASETSLVPASVTDAVRVFCADHLKFSVRNRGIGAVRVRATHADRDDGNENESAKEWQVRL
jgi:hypothetical protein